MAITLKVGEPRPAFLPNPITGGEARSKTIALLDGYDVEETADLIPVLQSLLAAAGLEPLKITYKITGSAEASKEFSESVSIEQANESALIDPIIEAVGADGDIEMKGDVDVSDLDLDVDVTATVTVRIEVGAEFDYLSTEAASKDEPIDDEVLHSVLCDHVRDRADAYGEWNVDADTIEIEEVEVVYA